VGGGDAEAEALERHLKHVFDNRFYDCTFRALWEFLERNGLTDNLVTVVTSDHGLSFGEKGEAWYAHGGARPYEYITRVPLVVRFANGSAATKHHGHHPQAVSLTDIFPTLVDLGLGEKVFPRPEPARATSLLERLEKRRFERVLVTECAVRPDSYRLHPGTMGYAKAIHDGDQKLIALPDLYTVRADPPAKAIWPLRARLGTSERFGSVVPVRSGSMVELFDLSADPMETVDLAARHPEVVERLTRLVPRSSWQCIPSRTAAAAPDRDPEAQETLRALGYIDGG
jgi:arylsulfatase A-like enzyme